jgi:RNA polymerase sigma factor (sigma-70 family)
VVMKISDLNDGQLLALFVETGETAAFEVLFHRHGAAVLRICERAAGRTVDADDVLQTVFIILADKAATLTDSASVAGWLYRVAWHTGTRHRRAELTRRRHERQAAVEAGFSFGSGVDPLLASELKYELHRALANLPNPYCDAIVLHHLHGQTLEETARVLGENPGTVAARLSRGRGMLRDQLAKMGIVVTAGVVSLLLGQSSLDLAALPVALAGYRVVAAAANPLMGGLGGGSLAATPPVGAAASWAAVLPWTMLRSALRTAAIFAVATTVVTITPLALAVGVQLAVGTAAVVADAKPAGNNGKVQASTSSTPESSSSKAASPSVSYASAGSSNGAASVPEPGSMAFLAGGSLLLLGRRRTPRAEVVQS